VRRETNPNRNRQSKIAIQNLKWKVSAERAAAGGSGDQVTAHRAGGMGHRANKNGQSSRRCAIFAVTVCVLLLALGAPAGGQQGKKIPRVGFLNASSVSSVAARLDAFRQGLRGLGYVERDNIVVEYRHAEGNEDRLHGFADELVRLKVDAIVAGGTVSARAAKRATTTVPIVMTNVSDPVALGLASSLSRPGGNVTGLSTLAPELSGKRLELLKELIPRLSRVAIVGDAINPGNPQAVKEAELAADAFGVQLQYYLSVRGAGDIETAFRAATKGHAEAVLGLTSAILFSQRMQIAEIAVKNRLPSVYGQPEYVEGGGLMSYGTNIADLYRRTASYVDRILKGAKPADLPIEQPSKFEMVINLRTAKQIGLSIPPNVLTRADRVIR
jgi:putative tryptophan/tyrosine transport system substrate-binding protein